MPIAQTIVYNCFAAIFLSAAIALALFLVSIPLICLLEGPVHNFVLKRKIRKIPITGPIALKDGRKPNVADFLTIKVHISEPQAKPLGSNDNVDDVEARKSVIGLQCPICSKDFGGIDGPGVMVVPQCFHICHTECFNKKFRHTNTCPSCKRAVDAKEIKEVKITSKFFNRQSKSSNDD